MQCNALLSFCIVMHCNIVGSVQKIFMSLVYAPSYQQSNREEKKIFNNIKTEEDEQFLSRCIKVNHPGTIVLLWNIFKWLERVTSSRFYRKRTVEHLLLCPTPTWTLAVERALTLKVSNLTEASIFINLNRPRRRSTSTIYTGLEPCNYTKVVDLSFVCQMSISKI